MINKIKLSFVLILLVGLLFISFKAGQLSKPAISFDSKYESIQELNKNLVTSFKLEANPSWSYSYIPAYSHIYYSKGDPIELAITLSLRNIDTKRSIKVEKILYYDTKGNLIRKYNTESVSIPPLGTKEIFIKNRDIEGGSGANFIVLFETDKQILPPIFEAIMIGEHYGKSYIFNSRGVTY